MAGVCNQSWGQDSARYPTQKSLLGEKELRKTDNRHCPGKRFPTAEEALREERGRRSSTPRSHGVHPRAPLPSEMPFLLRHWVPFPHHPSTRSTVPAPSPPLPCGRTLPTTSPRHAKRCFSCHGSAKAYSSCHVTQQSPEDENTYPGCPATWQELTTFTAEIGH